ncbi:MAG: hypothetical protein HUU46_22895 [Candidatus Hydrogenedentes bacterium]|nr:hypothetical protein [Candidatus Hydrogenedentota bacterium]
MISSLISLVVGIIGAVIGLIVGVVALIVGIVIPAVLAIVIPLIVVAVPLLLIMAAVWLLGLPSARRARRREPEDARIMRDINRGLARMENRLNSLETIMMDDESRSYSAR